MYTNARVVGQKVVVLQIIGRLSLKLSNKILKIIFDYGAQAFAGKTF